jgi:ABC-type multidrug transport system ATPase subunit/signal transduction histidine kinase
VLDDSPLSPILGSSARHSIGRDLEAELRTLSGLRPEDKGDATPGKTAGDANAVAEVAVSGLTVRFGSVLALDGVNLAVRAGEVIALAGENGAGKTTLIRAIGGDLTPVAGSIRLGGRAVAPNPGAAARMGIRIVWQDLALSENLDIASNVMLGNERRRHLLSDVSLHNEAGRVLHRLGIPLPDTTRPIRALSGGQRQMVAVARAMAHNPRLLMLDEPTASLGVREAALVERLITRLREAGTTILLSGHDMDLTFRLADRIVVLRHGRVVTEVSPSEVRPDDVLALVTGQPVDSSARFQLTRLHGLAGRLVTSDPSSSLSLILSALGAALGSERLCIHLLTRDGDPADDGQAAADDAQWGRGLPGSTTTRLELAASFGVPGAVLDAWARLPLGAGGGPVGLAAQRQEPVIEDSIRTWAGSWRLFGELARSARVASSWSVPVLGPGGLLGVITVFRAMPGKPRRDDLDLAALYAGYAASAIERDRLLDQVTARNRLLETIREMLQTLASAVPVQAGLSVALLALRQGLDAGEVALVTAEPDAKRTCRAYSGSGSGRAGEATAMSAAMSAAAGAALDRESPEGVAVPADPDAQPGDGNGGRYLSVSFDAPEGRTVLLARWAAGTRPEDAADLLEDAAHSLRMALARERALTAHQEAMALRQSQEMQYAFLRRLSHELRTPLTAITGYATSLLQQDVTWDAESQQRFLSRIALESGRLGRLVNDLLDFSAIESGILRLQTDWCDIPLVVDAAVAVLPPDAGARVTVTGAPGLPAIWADHDRLEQVFVNLLGNALSHNPPETTVLVTATPAEAGTVTVRVADDGEGLPAELARAVTDAAGPHPAHWPDTLASGVARPRRRGSGAGLGLSIASGIVAAHGGRMELEAVHRGTSFLITLPVEQTPTRTPDRPVRQNTGGNAQDAAAGGDSCG